jgi:hypothetical protein
MGVYVHLQQRITLLGNLPQVTILVVKNNSATIAAGEHASAICSGLIGGIFAFRLEVLLRNIPACPGPYHCGGNFKENL